MVYLKKISVFLHIFILFNCLHAGGVIPQREIVSSKEIAPQEKNIPPFAANLSRDERKKIDAKRNKEIEEVVDRVIYTHEVVPEKKDMTKTDYKPISLTKDMRRFLSSQYDDPLFINKSVTITLKDVSVRYALELIGKTVDFSFLIDPDVSGHIQSLYFKDVPLAIVLRHILRSNTPRLALIKDCQLYRITRLRQAKDIIYGRQEKDFSCEVIRLNNIVLNSKQKRQLEKLWRYIIGDQLGKPGVYMLIDEESKNVFCRGRKESVKQFKTFLQAIDTQMSQVKIEARFVCAEKGYEENIGFQWSGIYNRRASINRGFNLIGGGRPLSDISNNPQQQTQAGLVDWALNFLPTPDKIAKNIQLPFVFGGNDLNTKRLNLVLNTAEDRNEIKTILKPSVLTNDGESAQILVGENLPIETIVEESVEGRLRNVTTASYKDVGIQLRVKPVVAPDKRSVLLDIFIENSQQTDSVTTSNTTYPIIRTTRSHTKVRLQSGQTTMISGLIKDIKQTYKRQVPILSKIPIIGWLLSGSRRVKNDMQLLIFITPTIV